MKQLGRERLSVFTNWRAIVGDTKAEVYSCSRAIDTYQHGFKRII